MSARDVVAKEVCCAGDCINADSPGPLPCFGLRHAANRADRILSALSAAGYAVVPVEALALAAEALHDRDVGHFAEPLEAAIRETKA